MPRTVMGIDISIPSYIAARFGLRSKGLMHILDDASLLIELERTSLGTGPVLYVADRSGARLSDDALLNQEGRASLRIAGGARPSPENLIVLTASA